jgi:ubiquinone/menaquinone biosynthesis C-methylase UbiE
MFLGRPLLDRLESCYGSGANVLDIATGTGRLPLALVEIPFYEGYVVGVDSSYGMLQQAAIKTSALSDRVHLVEGSAYPLPFADQSFVGVTIMEALEFLPNRDDALAEASRVLRPGGWLLVTNRIGSEARFMPGRTESPVDFEARLKAIGFTDVSTWPWQSYYDLIWAMRSGDARSAPVPEDWYSALTCPGCTESGTWSPRSGRSKDGVEQLTCTVCGYIVGRTDGIWRI